MFQRRIPELLRHAPTPGVRGFAVLAGMEATTRGILTSVFPVIMYKSLGSAQSVTSVYFLVGIASLVTALFTPWIMRFISRRLLFTGAILTMIMGSTCAATGSATLIPLGLTANTMAVVVISICFNTYVMDYVERSELGRCETLRLFYSGAAWTLGPFLGVYLMDIWAPAPFIISIAACIVLLVTFWILRLGNGKVITRARAPAKNPLLYLRRFVAQPRLVTGWVFVVIRSCGWWVYVVYLPIFALELGFGDKVGGLSLSISNGLLFCTPLMLRWMQKQGVRQTVFVGFFGSGFLFIAAALSGATPLAVIVLLMLGSIFLILLDISAGLPFLMAVKPSERTEMSAVYATYRDTSGVISPAVGGVVLTVAPLIAIFSVSGIGLLLCACLSMKLHPRLGTRKVVRAIANFE